MSKPRSLADIFKNKSNSSSEVPEDPEKYRKTNDSLVAKVIQLKSELTMSRKLIDKLRKENEALQEQNRELSTTTEDERIEILVSQRVKKKLQSLTVLNEKALDTLQGTITQWRSEIDNLKVQEPSGVIGRPRQTLSEKPKLKNVEEEPLVSTNMVPEDESGSDVEDEPKKVERSLSSVKRGRRSGFVEPPTEFLAPKPRLSSKGAEKESTATGKTGSRGSVGNRRNVPETPKMNGRQRKPLAVSEVSFTPVAKAEVESGVGDTVRRKRLAAAKIGSLKEPATGNKLRRPGKYDEPVPYVSTFFYN